MYNSYCNPRYLIIPLPFWYLFIQLFLKSSILLSVSVPASALTTFVNHASFVINIQMMKHKILLHIIDAFCLFFICSTPFSGYSIQKSEYPIHISSSIDFHYLTLQNCNENLIPTIVLYPRAMKFINKIDMKLYILFQLRPLKY